MSQTTVSQIYNSVINEVIEEVREAALDEGIDEQVLSELKALWWQKLGQSNSLEPQQQSQTSVSAPTIRRQPVQNEKYTAAPQSQPVDLSGAASTATMALPTLIHPGSQVLNNLQLQAGNYTIAAMQQHPIHIQPAQPGRQLAQQQRQPMQLQRQPVQQRQHLQIQPQNLSSKQEPTSDEEERYLVYECDSEPELNFSSIPNQVDGCEDDLNEELSASATCSVSLSEKQTQVEPSVRRRVPPLPHNLKPGDEVEVIVQLDGGDDSDSSDDLADDDDDDPDLEDIPAAEEDDEAPLNSEDDLSGGEPDEVFETENLVVCQYDKITRAKNRWRFNLKDGIMSIKGKDYIFSKALGEAEW